MANPGSFKEKLLEGAFFRPAWHSIFINPYFINRRSLYRAMKEFAAATPKNARILDVGCGLKPYRDLFASGSYTGIDIQGGGHSDATKHADAYYDGENIPFPDASFEAVICTQVYEHAKDPEKLAREISRVLAPTGRVIVTMPFIYPEHEIPYDFHRFTRYEHMRLMEKIGLESAEIRKSTGLFGTFSQIFVIAIFEGIRFPASALKATLSISVFAPIQIAGLALDGIFGKAGPAMDYIVTASKPLKK